MKMQNLDVPCRTAVLGSQIWDDSTQCRMVDRSAHVSKSKTKQKKATKKKPTKQQQKRKIIQTTKQGMYNKKNANITNNRLH